MAEQIKECSFTGEYPPSLKYAYHSPIAANVLVGGEQSLVLGDLESTLLTTALATCSAFALWDRKTRNGKYGLLHINPSDGLTPIMKSQLDLLRGGWAVQIKGNRSIAQEKTIKYLKRKFNITLVDIIPIDTVDPDGNSKNWWDFDVIYSPRHRVSVTQTRPIQTLSTFSIFDK